MTKCDNEWYNEWQWITTSGTTSSTTSDNEWYSEWQQVTMNDSERLFWPIFFFFREEITNRHPKENLLNLEEDLDEDLLHLEQI